MYVCGPTVYDDAHLGHARSAVSFDLLRRVLIASGYNVIFARNITDIDDKIVKKVLESDRSLSSITNTYLERYRAEMRALGCLEPDMEPRALENLPAMFDLIQKLLDNGTAYIVDNGDIYFEVAKDDGYFSLSGRHSDDNQSRIEQVSQKKDPKDFALWKAIDDEDDISFGSPFGKGRPGWHLECSAMIARHLATAGEHQIDIHGGGADLLFPHHENECAQTRCAYGQELARYWVHNGFVTIDGEKMSKSLGNSFYLKEALKAYEGEIIRFYLLGAHYRADLAFNEEDLLGSKKRLDRFYRLKKRTQNAQIQEADKEFCSQLLNALGDDLNISVALSHIDEMIAVANDALDKNPKDKVAASTAAANLEFVSDLLGIGSHDPQTYFQLGVDEEQKAAIERLIQKRSQAKSQKEFATADAIRDELLGMGIGVMDTPQGCVWEKI